MLTCFIAAFCLFTPPDGFDITDPKTPSRHSIASFLDKSKSGFCPSINLTHEKISCSFEEYLDIVSSNCKAKKQRWRKVGKIETKSGAATLVEIELKNQFGKVALLQAILHKAGEVHILTSGMLKRDFPKYAGKIEKTFQSMELVDDLFQLAKNPENLQSCWQKRGEDLESFRKAVLRETERGPVFQVQLLRKK